MAILGVILAGGRSSRMGGHDKATLMLGSSRLVDRVAARLGRQVDGLVLNANVDPGSFAGIGYAVVPDPLPDHAGPLAGILAGLDYAAAAGFDLIATAAVDTPFFPEDFVARLRASGADLALAATAAQPEARLHPTFGLWPVTLRHDLRAALASGQRKLRHFADLHGAAVVAFAGDPDPFFNINTPEDLAEARGRIGDARPGEEGPT